MFFIFILTLKILNFFNLQKIIVKYNYL